MDDNGDNIDLEFDDETLDHEEVDITDLSQDLSQMRSKKREEQITTSLNHFEKFLATQRMGDRFDRLTDRSGDAWLSLLGTFASYLLNAKRDNSFQFTALKTISQYVGCVKGLIDRKFGDALISK
jgi:chromatin segregation and condensation protein Rec8/ScpA/Scc1 (kleisin family)